MLIPRDVSITSSVARSRIGLQTGKFAVLFNTAENTASKV